MYFRLKLIYQIKPEYLEPLSRYSVLNDFLPVSYTHLDVYKRQTDSHGVTGGVYKTRERIHRSMLICDY